MLSSLDVSPISTMRVFVCLMYLTADWMNEGGQSSTGQLLDFMIDTHPASDKLKSMAKERGMNHFSLLTEILKKLVVEKKAPFISYLTKDYYLYPDLHGQFVDSSVACPVAEE